MPQIPSRTSPLGWFEPRRNGRLKPIIGRCSKGIPIPDNRPCGVLEVKASENTAALAGPMSQGESTLEGWVDGICGIRRNYRRKEGADSCLANWVDRRRSSSCRVRRSRLFPAFFTFVLITHQTQRVGLISGFLQALPVDLRG